ncbi:hypothetical protein D3C87_1074310 [compost metagenome]
MEVYPIFSFKREYHLRLLQDEAESNSLYPLYTYIFTYFPDFFETEITENFYVSKIYAPIEEINSNLGDKGKIARTDYNSGYYLSMDRIVSKLLHTINAIFYPFMSIDNEYIATNINSDSILYINDKYPNNDPNFTGRVDLPGIKCDTLFNVLNMKDSSLDESYEYYLKILSSETFMGQLNLAEIYRQCVKQRDENLKLETDYIASYSDFAIEVYDIIFSKNVVLYRQPRTEHVVIKGDVEEMRDQIEALGITVGHIIKGDTFFADIGSVDSKILFMMAKIQNPYIRRCYYYKIW